jgi:hypothetical protein
MDVVVAKIWPKAPGARSGIVPVGAETVERGSAFRSLGLIALAAQQTHGRLLLA